MGDNDLPVTKLSQQTNRNMILNIVPEKKNHGKISLRIFKTSNIKFHQFGLNSPNFCLSSNNCLKMSSNSGNADNSSSSRRSKASIFKQTDDCTGKIVIATVLEKFLRRMNQQLQMIRWAKNFERSHVSTTKFTPRFHSPIKTTINSVHGI